MPQRAPKAACRSQPASCGGACCVRGQGRAWTAVWRRSRRSKSVFVAGVKIMQGLPFGHGSIRCVNPFIPMIARTFPRLMLMTPSKQEIKFHTSCPDFGSFQWLRAMSWFRSLLPRLLRRQRRILRQQSCSRAKPKLKKGTEKNGSLLRPFVAIWQTLKYKMTIFTIGATHSSNFVFGKVVIYKAFAQC